MTTTVNKNEDEAFIKKVLLKESVQPAIMEPEKAVFIKKEITTARYLKVYPFYRQYSTPGKRAKIVPEIRLCGNWLEEAGFEANSYVSVTVMDGLLVIRAAKTDEAGH